MHAVPRDRLSSGRARSDLYPGCRGERIGARPSIGIVRPEDRSSRLGPVRRFGPVLQIEVLQSREGERRLATKRLIRRRGERTLSCRIPFRGPQERIACTTGGGSRAAPRNLLSRRIVGIGCGEPLYDCNAVGSVPQCREIEGTNGCRADSVRVFLTGDPHAEGDRVRRRHNSTTGSRASLGMVGSDHDLVLRVENLNQRIVVALVDFDQVRVARH